MYNDDETLRSKKKKGKKFSAAIFGETGEIGTATLLSTVFHGRFVTRHGSVIRYTGELDKAIKRGNNRESEPWGDYTAVFPPAPNEPSVHKCFWGRTRPRSPGVLGDAGMLAARGRTQWTIRLPFSRELRRFVDCFHPLLRGLMHGMEIYERLWK